MQRVGVIGLGTVGQTHVAALRSLPAHVYGADPSATARDRAKPHLAEAFADYRDMIARAGLAGVVIATPPRTHREIALHSLSAGLGVLCEKPLALTLDDCRAIAEASTGHVFQVGFCHRFQPQVSALRDLLDAGAIGTPILVNIGFVHGLTREGREWITDPLQSGGGVLFDSGSHAIDLFRYLVGNVNEVHGLTATWPIEDSSVVCLRSGTVLGTITLSWKTPPWQGMVEVIGSGGRARVDYADERVVLRTRLGDDRRWRSVRTSRMSRFVAQMNHFLDCLRGESLPLAGVRDGMEATRLVLQIYANARGA
jgi:UDP-N-acetyl-2-amino-2-deoxyglucuronate dehydrogenase